MRQPNPVQELARIRDVLVVRLADLDRLYLKGTIEKRIWRFQRIDALISTSGFGLFGTFESPLRSRTFDQLAASAWSVAELTHSTLPRLKDRRARLAMNLSRGVGIFTLPSMPLYCADKFAKDGFSAAFGHEIASRDVGVEIVSHANPSMRALAIGDQIKPALLNSFRTTTVTLLPLGNRTRSNFMQRSTRPSGAKSASGL